MRRLVIDSNGIELLKNEIRRSSESRFHHRLHSVFLVAQGLSCSEVAQYLGSAPRTIEYWVRRFQSLGTSGLIETPRSGRPSQLSKENLERIKEILSRPPAEAGIRANRWKGIALSQWIKRKLKITLSVRQCQRLVGLVRGGQI